MWRRARAIARLSVQALIDNVMPPCDEYVCKNWLGFALLRYEAPLALICSQMVDIGLFFDTNHMGPS